MIRPQEGIEATAFSLEDSIYNTMLDVDSNQYEEDELMSILKEGIGIFNQNTNERTLARSACLITKLLKRAYKDLGNENYLPILQSFFSKSHENLFALNIILELFFDNNDLSNATYLTEEQKSLPFTAFKEMDTKERTIFNKKIPRFLLTLPFLLVALVKPETSDFLLTDEFISDVDPASVAPFFSRDPLICYINKLPKVFSAIMTRYIEAEAMVKFMSKLSDEDFINYSEQINEAIVTDKISKEQANKFLERVIEIGADKFVSKLMYSKILFHVDPHEISQNEFELIEKCDLEIPLEYIPFLSNIDDCVTILKLTKCDRSKLPAHILRKAILTITFDDEIRSILSVIDVFDMEFFEQICDFPSNHTLFHLLKEFAPNYKNSYIELVKRVIKEKKMRKLGMALITVRPDSESFFDLPEVNDWLLNLDEPMPFDFWCMYKEEPVIACYRQDPNNLFLYKAILTVREQESLPFKPFTEEDQKQLMEFFNKEVNVISDYADIDEYTDAVRIFIWNAIKDAFAIYDIENVQQPESKYAYYVLILTLLIVNKTAEFIDVQAVENILLELEQVDISQVTKLDVESLKLFSYFVLAKTNSFSGEFLQVEDIFDYYAKLWESGICDAYPDFKVIFIDIFLCVLEYVDDSKVNSDGNYEELHKFEDNICDLIGKTSNSFFPELLTCKFKYRIESIAKLIKQDVLKGKIEQALEGEITHQMIENLMEIDDVKLSDKCKEGLKNYVEQHKTDENVKLVAFYNIKLDNSFDEELFLKKPTVENQKGLSIEYLVKACIEMSDSIDPNTEQNLRRHDAFRAILSDDVTLYLDFRNQILKDVNYFFPEMDEFHKNFSSLYKRSKNVFLNAINHCYLVIPGKSPKLMGRFEYPPIPKCSPRTQDFFEKFFTTSITLNNLSSWTALKDLVTLYPFLMTQEQFKLLYQKVIEVIADMPSENPSDEDDFYLKFTALYTLACAIDSPALCDYFFTLLPQDFDNLNNIQLNSLLAIVYRLISVSEFQTIAFSYFYRDDWINKILPVLRKDGYNESKVTILQIVENYFQFVFDAKNDKVIAIFTKLLEEKYPFSIQYKNLISMDINAKAHVNLHDFIYIELSSFIAEKVALIEKYLFEYNGLNNKDMDEDLLRIVPKQFVQLKKDEIPGINADVFNDLSSRMQSIVIYQNMNQIKQPIPPSVYYKLVHLHPGVLKWFKDKPSIILMPQNMLYLYHITKYLEDIQYNPKDIFFEYAFKNDFYLELFNCVIDPFVDQYASSCLMQVVQNPFCGLNLLSSIPINTITFEMLKDMSRCSAYKDHFIDLCWDKLFDYYINVPSPRNSHIIRLFDSGIELPFKAVIIIKSSLIYGDEDEKAEALSILETCENNMKEFLAPLVQDMFKTIIDDFDIENDEDILIKALLCYPSLAQVHNNILITILADQFKAEKLNTKLILILLNQLAPQTSLSLTTIARTDNALPIPQPILAMAPQFWKVIEENKGKLDQIASDFEYGDIFNEGFFTRFPSLISFEKRSKFFFNEIRDLISNNITDINVRRSHILDEAYRQLALAPASKFLCEFRVNFIEERGHDMGGLQKDFFTNLVKELFNPNYALFQPTENGLSYEPNLSSYVNFSEHINYFKLAGKVIARAVLGEIYVEAHLTTTLLKLLLNLNVALKDLETVDSELYRSLESIRNDDITGIGLYFVYCYEDLGVRKEVELKPGGRNIEVTNENKEEYVNLVTRLRLVDQIKDQTKAFVDSFHMILPAEKLKRFTPQELDLIICGVPDIDIDDLENNIEIVNPYTKDHRIIKDLFRLFRSWDKETMAKFLLFLTGSSQVPVGGFASLRDKNIPVKIQKMGDATKLPVAHTCFNTLDLPEYNTFEDLEQKLTYAILNTDSFEIV